jgi:transcriptional regulator with XRE-family HTH domain
MLQQASTKLLCANSTLLGMGKPLKETVRLNLRRLMDQRGWNQVELARRSGVSQTMIGKVLRGESVPTVDTVEALANAFKLEALEFMREPGTAPDLVKRFEEFLKSESGQREAEGPDRP